MSADRGASRGESRSRAHDRASNRESGAILLATLLIMSLMATLVAEIGADTRASVRRTIAIEDGLQADHYLNGAEDYALAYISQQFSEIDDAQLNVLLSVPQSATLPIPDGAVSLVIADGSHCAAPTDALVENAPADTRLINLFSTVANIPIFEAQSLMYAVRDWQDGDQNTDGIGAEDGNYLLREPAYRTADSPMTTVAELRAVRDMDRERFALIAPWMCARGQTAVPLNVNTIGPVDAPLFAASLGEGVLPENVLALLSTRPEGGWDAGALEAAIESAGYAYDAELLGTEVEVLRVDIRVDYRGRTRQARLYMQRSSGARLSRVRGEAIPPLRPALVTEPSPSGV